MIVQNLLEEFKTDFGLDKEKPDIVFEHFINYCTLENHIIKGRIYYENRSILEKI